MKRKIKEFFDKEKELELGIEYKDGLIVSNTLWCLGDTITMKFSISEDKEKNEDREYIRKSYHNDKILVSVEKCLLNDELKLKKVIFSKLGIEIDNFKGFNDE